MDSDTDATTLRTGRSRSDPPDPGGTVAVGTEIGRYVVLAELGRGGTGVVVRAFDPELDRQVAIKLVLGDADGDGSTGRAAILAEARALAKLRHDNVAVVYDVGTHDGRVWGAMELVPGQSLRAWLQSGRRSVAARDRVLAEAARGLAAAHDAGIVHRDFKPDNVVVADRAVVVDFGLARAVGSDEDTDAGAPAGTVAYLAPELYDGVAPSLRSDVYAYCVTAWEVLTGSRPWSAPDETALRQAKQQVPPLPRTSGVSRRLGELLRAGLSPDPALRPASLSPLLAALQVRRVRPQRWLPLLGIAVVGALAWSAARRPSCDPPEHPPLAAATETSLHAAIDEAMADEAATTWRAVRVNLDAFGREYARQYRDACEATHVRHAQSGAMLDARVACLQRRRAQLDALATELAVGSRTELAETPRAIAKLAGRLSCGSTTPTLAPAVAALHGQLDRVEVLELLSRFSEALDLARTVEADAEAIDARDAQLWARYRQGRLLQLTGDAAAAAPLLSQVHWDAEDAQLHALAGQAGIYVVYLHAAVFNDAATALSWAPHVAAAVRRGGDDVGDRAALIENTGVAKLYDHRIPEAYDDFATSLSLRESAPGDAELSIVSSLGNLGIAAEEMQRYDEAIEHQRRALQILSRRLGEGHPHTARVVDNLGTARLRKGEIDAAIELFERALTARRAVYGPEHRSIAISRVHLGLAHLQAGRAQPAIDHYDAALAILQALPQPGHNEAICHEGLAHAHAALEHWPLALRHAEAALDGLPDSLPDDHPERAGLREIIARAQAGYTDDDAQ